MKAMRKVPKEGTSDFCADMSAALDYRGAAVTKLIIVMVALTKSSPGRWTWKDLNDIIGGGFEDNIREVMRCAADDEVFEMSDEDENGVHLALNWTEIYKGAGR